MLPQSLRTQSYNTAIPKSMMANRASDFNFVFTLKALRNRLSRPTVCYIFTKLWGWPLLVLFPPLPVKRGSFSIAISVSVLKREPCPTGSSFRRHSAVAFTYADQISACRCSEALVRPLSCSSMEDRRFLGGFRTKASSAVCVVVLINFYNFSFSPASR